jgi:hypothetical protein
MPYIEAFLKEIFKALRKSLIDSSLLIQGNPYQPEYPLPHVNNKQNRKSTKLKIITASYTYIKLNGDKEQAYGMGAIVFRTRKDTPLISGQPTHAARLRAVSIQKANALFCSKTLSYYKNSAYVLRVPVGIGIGRFI